MHELLQRETTQRRQKTLHSIRKSTSVPLLHTLTSHRAFVLSKSSEFNRIGQLVGSKGKQPLAGNQRRMWTFAGRKWTGTSRVHAVGLFGTVWRRNDAEMRRTSDFRYGGICENQSIRKETGEIAWGFNIGRAFRPLSPNPLSSSFRVGRADLLTHRQTLA